jgi:hypothetical protein
VPLKFPGVLHHFVMEWFDRLLARREEVIRLFATKPSLGAGKVYYRLVCVAGGANMLRKTFYELVDRIWDWRNCGVAGDGLIRRLELLGHRDNFHGSC